MKNTQQVIKFREARHLSKIAPDRFKLWAKVESGNLLWVLYEYPELTSKPVVYSESHHGLNVFGWNVRSKKVSFESQGVSLFILPVPPSNW